MLDFYDHGTVKKPKGSINDVKISYEDCLNVIQKLRFNAESNLFAVERIEHGLESIINDIYQTFDTNDVYETIEEKAANFLYLIVKNHVFVDGNKDPDLVTNFMDTDLQKDVNSSRSPNEQTKGMSNIVVDDENGIILY